MRNHRNREAFYFMEVWKDIQDYEGIYQISDLGRVKSLIRKSTGTNTNKISYLKIYLSHNGYSRVTLSKNGITKNFLIHRLLAIHFISNTKNKKCVNHKNGIRNDNSLQNLEWVSYSENSKHGFIENKRKNPNRKLEESDVFEIKKELINYKHGDVLRISRKYNVSKYIISLIKVGKSYKEENLR